MRRHALRVAPSCRLLAAALLITLPRHSAAQAPAAPDVAALLARATAAERAGGAANERSAHVFASRALSLAMSRHDVAGEIEALRLIGWFYGVEGGRDSSLHYYQAATRRAREARDSTRLFGLEQSLAHAFGRVGQTDSTRAIYARLLALSRERNDSHGMASLLGDMAGSESQTQPDSAIALAQQARAIDESIGDTADARLLVIIVVQAVHARTTPLLVAGRTAEALPYLRLAADLQAAAGDWMGVFSDTALAQIFLGLHERDSAVAHYRRALATAQRAQQPWLLAPVLTSLIPLEESGAQRDSVIAHLRLLATAADRERARDGAAVHHRLALAYERADAPDSAMRQRIEEIAILSEDRLDARDLWQAQNDLALLLARRGAADSAAKLLAGAIRSYERYRVGLDVRGIPPHDSAAAYVGNCRDLTAMVLNLITLHRRHGTPADAVPIIALASAVELLPPDLRQLAGTGLVPLLQPDSAAAVRGWEMLAAASFADDTVPGSWSHRLAALGARERYVLGGLIPFDQPPPRGHPSFALRTPAKADRPCVTVAGTDLDRRPYDDDGFQLMQRLPSGASLLAYGYADDTLLVYLVGPGPNLQTIAALARERLPRSSLAAMHPGRGSAADAARLESILLPESIRAQLPKGGRLLIALAPELDANTLLSLPLPDGGTLGSRFTTVVGTSIFRLTAR